MKKATKLILTLAITAAVTGTSGTVPAVAEGDYSYYVCYSTENYAVRNANKMTEEDGEYYVYDVTLNSLVNFYVTDGSGRRWYARDGKEMSVKETESHSYDIKFSPDSIYTEAESEWNNSGCNVTYRFYEPAQYSIEIGAEEYALKYNPFHTAFDEYCISTSKDFAKNPVSEAQYIQSGNKVVYGGEEHVIEHDGYYRIIFTPGERRNGNDYAYNDKGEYGTGEEYIYNLYIEDAPRYYLKRENEEGYILLNRYEKSVSAKEYRSAEKFFISERDYSFRYNVYEKSIATNEYVLIDDDNDDETSVSKIRISDAGWYEFSFVDGGERFASSCAYYSRYDFNGYYAAGEFNGYCYDENGEENTGEKFRFKLLEDDDDDYDKDYDQYVLYLNVSQSSLKNGDVEFYITDGDRKYKNGTEYIKISRAGEYKILFSDEHIYGNGRRYRYVLLSGDVSYSQLEIGTAEEFIEFARSCKKDADYSKNKEVYLTADIDFANVKFVSVGAFSGKFYGGYHTLKNIKLDKDNPSVINILNRDGLIERVTVQNLTLTDKDADYAGVIGKNYGTVTNVNVYGKITGNNYVGAVAGFNGRSNETESTGSTDTNTLYRNGVIKNCKTYAEVSGTVHCGGICGFNSGEINSCENRGAVSFRKQSSSSTPFNIGGITGYSAGKITACENFGEVDGAETLYSGGICGLCTGEIYYSFNNANVTGKRYTGGVIGYYGTLSNKNDSNDFFGGLSYEEIYNRYFGNDENDFEQISGEKQIIKYCANYASVTADAYAGGIAGYADVAALKISCCENEGNVSVDKGSYAGGIAGYFSGAALESCVASGTVSAKGLNAGEYVGGIAGYGDNITVCSSVCELIGKDYIGGIAGYNRSGLSSCWANVNIILTDKEGKAENIGNIAGFTEALDNANDLFRNGFEYNFYVYSEGNTYGGIGGTDYKVSYDFAASPINSEDLAFEGTVSPYLDGFNTGAKWQGSDTRAYPVPGYLIEADECDEFGDEEEFAKLFGVYGERLSATALKNSQELYTVSFLEWNEDNGSLYEDGILQVGNFDPILTIRLPLGETIPLPEFKWAKLVNGRYIYEGSDASYFVTFPAAGVVNGNTVIYAVYREIATTISTDDDKILVEGEFDVDTKVELVKSVNGYELKFTLNGERIEAGEVLVKFLPDNEAEYCKIELFAADGTNTQIQEISGKYLSFPYSDGDYFSVIVKEKSSGLASWAWALIGGLIGAIVVAAAFASPIIVKKVKLKKAECNTGKENTEE